MRIYGVTPSYARNLRQQNNVNYKQNVSFGLIDEEAKPYLPKEFFEEPEDIFDDDYRTELKYSENTKLFTIKYDKETQMPFFELNIEEVEKSPRKISLYGAYNGLKEEYVNKISLFDEKNRHNTEKDFKAHEADLKMLQKYPFIITPIYDMKEIFVTCGSFMTAEKEPDTTPPEDKKPSGTRTLTRTEARKEDEGSGHPYNDPQTAYYW